MSVVEKRMSYAVAVPFVPSSPGAVQVNVADESVLGELARSATFAGAVVVIDHMGEPDIPLELISGASFGSSFVDVDAIKRIHAAA